MILYDRVNKLIPFILTGAEINKTTISVNFREEEIAYAPKESIKAIVDFVNAIGEIDNVENLKINLYTGFSFTIFDSNQFLRKLENAFTKSLGILLKKSEKLINLSTRYLIFSTIK